MYVGEYCTGILREARVPEYGFSVKCRVVLSVNS